MTIAYVFDCMHELEMAVAAISLLTVCEDSCGGPDHYPCLSCWLIVTCNERDMAYATILVRFVYFIAGMAEKRKLGGM